MDRLLGGDGSAPTVRLGLPEDATPAQVREAIAGFHGYWRRIARSPLTEPQLARAADVLLRTCEGLAAALGPQPPAPPPPSPPAAPTPPPAAPPPPPAAPAAQDEATAEVLPAPEADEAPGKLPPEADEDPTGEIRAQADDDATGEIQPATT
jgi:hypothetical protein